MRFLVCLFLLSSISFSGCFWGDDGDQIDINERYYLRSTEPRDSYHLGFYDNDEIGVGVFNKQITAVGYNDDFIIIQVHDGHYIVKMIEKGDHQMAEENIEGGMHEPEFRERVEELGISDLKFTKTFTRQ